MEFCYCPSLANTTRMVRSKISQSSNRLQFRMYPTSSSIQVSNEGFRRAVTCHRPVIPGVTRSEEHTSELQSHSDLVCRLLLEKKKKKEKQIKYIHNNNQHAQQH